MWKTWSLNENVPLMECCWKRSSEETEKVIYHSKSYDQRLYLLYTITHEVPHSPSIQSASLLSLIRLLPHYYNWHPIHSWLKGKEIAPLIPPVLSSSSTEKLQIHILLQPDFLNAPSRWLQLATPVPLTGWTTTDPCSSLSLPWPLYLKYSSPIIPPPPGVAFLFSVDALKLAIIELVAVFFNLYITTRM